MNRAVENVEAVAWSSVGDFSHSGSDTWILAMQKRSSWVLHRRHLKAGLWPQVGVSSVGAAGHMLLFKTEITLP